ncbi:MAG: hypothetical protein DME26_12130 [Verrucomicrobia bacterium]|nr:MAG: hypothetical protein DME26_12130 [Verrucomicrobiota bacterium]
MPFHLAMRLAAMPPALVNVPPTYMSLPLAVSAVTKPLMPLPNPDQLLPSQRAMPERIFVI